MYKGISPIRFRPTNSYIRETSPRFQAPKNVELSDEDINDRQDPQNKSLEVDEDQFSTPYHRKYKTLVSF